MEGLNKIYFFNIINIYFYVSAQFYLDSLSYLWLWISNMGIFTKVRYSVLCLFTSSFFAWVLAEVFSW
jgi:hypothetical protein